MASNDKIFMTSGSKTCATATLATLTVDCGFKPSAVMVFNKTTGSTYLYNDTMTSGTCIRQPGGRELGVHPNCTISIGTTNTQLATTAFTIWASGAAPVAVAAVAAGTAVIASVANKSKWCAYGMECSANGLIISLNSVTATEATYTTEALAIAARVAALTAARVDLGYYTVGCTAGASFVGATTAFDSADYTITAYVNTSCLTYLASGGVTPYDGTYEPTISSGTTPGSGNIGFQIGTSMQTLSATLYYWAWR